MSQLLEQQFAIWFMGIGATAVTVILMWLIYFVSTYVYKAKLLEREERRLMIEKGMTPPQAQAAGWPAMKAREAELRFQERRLLIEKGLQPGAENGYNVLTELLTREEKEKEDAPERYLRRGLKALAFGLGLATAYVIFRTSGIDASDETRNWFLFFAVISAPIAFYGVANLIYYRATRDKASVAATSAPDQGR